MDSTSDKGKKMYWRRLKTISNEKNSVTLDVTRAEQSLCLKPKQTSAKTKHSGFDHVGATE